LLGVPSTKQPERSSSSAEASRATCGTGSPLLTLSSKRTVSLSRMVCSGQERGLVCQNRDQSIRSSGAVKLDSPLSHYTSCIFTSPFPSTSSFPIRDTFSAPSSADSSTSPTSAPSATSNILAFPAPESVNGEAERTFCPLRSAFSLWELLLLRLLFLPCSTHRGRGWVRRLFLFLLLCARGSFGHRGSKDARGVRARRQVARVCRGVVERD
jgi:hypothetical protein